LNTSQGIHNPLG